MFYVVSFYLVCVAIFLLSGKGLDEVDVGQGCGWRQLLWVPCRKRSPRGWGIDFHVRELSSRGLIIIMYSVMLITWLWCFALTASGEFIEK